MYYYKFIVVGVDGVVVVKVIGQVVVVVDYVGWFWCNMGDGVMDFFVLIGDFRVWQVYDMFLCVIYYGYFGWNVLIYYCMCCQGFVGVEDFDLVVIFDIQIFCICFVYLDNWFIV